MPRFWKDKDGRWRTGVIVWTILFVTAAIYDFVKEGWRSLSAIQFALWGACIALTSNMSNDSGGRWWQPLTSPAVAIGFSAGIAATILFLFRALKLL